MWGLQESWEPDLHYSRCEAAVPTPDCAAGDEMWHLGPCPFRTVPRALALCGSQTAVLPLLAAPTAPMAQAAFCEVQVKSRSPP